MINNVIHAIDQVARTFPDRVAYDNLGQTHTYHELTTAADNLAQALAALGLPREQPIMIYGGQQFEMIASFLGCVKAGYAYIPVDAHTALERVADIAAIAEPSAILAVDACPLEAPATTTVITPDQLQAHFATPAAVPTDLTPVAAEDNFYIIFTSGTTGKPKGVQITHTNLCSFVDWMGEPEYGFTAAPMNVLAQPPYSFDLSVMDWVPALVYGHTLKALPKAAADDFKQLFAVLPTLAISTWVSTPSFADVALLNPAFTAENYPDLRTFLFCGEALTVTTAQKLKERFPAARVMNTYGPTEATVAVTGLEITADHLTASGALPIGHVKADTVVQIQDPDGQPLPAGELGELVIAGPSVSKGYLNNPEKTAAAFTTVDGQQAYRTGDLGIVDVEGCYHYRGRSDFQIKLHGYRIELEDVAQTLQASQWVEQAVAVPRYDADGKVKQLLAIIVPKANTFEKPILLTNAIKADLAEIMMPYMMPSRFMYRESLPLTPNGKINLKALIAEVNPHA